LFLNIGGVANITYVGMDGDLIAFDTGPGNGLLDDWVFARTGQPFDRDGELAAHGRPSRALLDQFLAHPYFAQPPPKSLDRNAFLVRAVERLSDADGAATLLQFSVGSVRAALRHLPQSPRAAFASGGGRHNKELMRSLRDGLAPLLVERLEALGFDGDATEAQAFAFLAVRSLDGSPLSYPLTTGVREPLSGGLLSRPGEPG